MAQRYKKDLQYAKFSAYGFLKNLKLFEPFLILFLLEKNLSFTSDRHALRLPGDHDQPPGSPYRHYR